MKKVLNFLQWQFQGTFKNPSFYGLVISLVGVVAGVAGCPAPWPMIMNVGGLCVIMVDLAYTWFSVSYRLYQMEQDRIVRELERK